MAEGRTNVGIARRLWLTDRTVETHVSSIMAKLGLHEPRRTTAACWPCSPGSGCGRTAGWSATRGSVT